MAEAGAGWFLPVACLLATVLGFWAVPLAIAGSKLSLNHARDHGVAASLQQMSLLQSAIFDTGEMAQAIAGWKTKTAADFAPLTPAAKT